ncbi:hypothetical protein [Gimesia aquarii]|uniref:Uncharacterized protein n=1 Tax=Gimesia aquarii TaxID=2527964 RepID=A0A517VV43_9PLAN|nr:hypothetical protein [Gimesia aquarii]QDT96853.1 hypothetical protein V144x_23110 [Gimesia aquarii]
MNEKKPTQPSRLIDSLGQELTACKEKPDSPVKASGGQWAFEYSGTNVKKLTMSVTVQLHSPIPMSLELYSELNECGIQQLKKWLDHLPLEKRE